MQLPAPLELTPAWNEISSELRRLLGDGTYEAWLAPVKAVSFERETLLLAAPEATRMWVSKRFERALETCVRAVLGAEVRVAFTGDRDTPTHSRRADESFATGVAVGASALNPRYSFDQFIIGAGNQLAHAAALAVAENPGSAYNPLFIYARPGLGKTHLLHAIGNFVLAFGDRPQVRYTTVEGFTNHFISALGSRSLERFKHSYRDADVLLVDDVQFLASKAKTEEEFFHTFNALYETGAQLVLTCDRLPRQLLAIEDRLRERFAAGLVTEIASPNFSTRVAILRKRASLDRVPLTDPAVLELIAARITDNVRALEGALIRIVAHHSLTQCPIDLTLAGVVLDDLAAQGAAVPLTVADIQATVAGHYEITVEELVSTSRHAQIAWPRQVALYLARNQLDVSLQFIGDAFGSRSHATVLHACKRVAERIAGDQQAKADVHDLEHALRNKLADRDC